MFRKGVPCVRRILSSLGNGRKFPRSNSTENKIYLCLLEQRNVSCEGKKNPCKCCMFVMKFFVKHRSACIRIRCYPPLCTTSNSKMPTFSLLFPVEPTLSSPQTPCTPRNSRTFLEASCWSPSSRKNESESRFSLASFASIPAVRPLQAEAEAGIHAGDWFPRKNWIRPSGHWQIGHEESISLSQSEESVGGRASGSGEWMSDSLPSILHVSYKPTTALFSSP